MEILKEFKKTVLGKDYVRNGYTDKEILKNVSKKVMLDKIKNNDKSVAFKKILDVMIAEGAKSKVPMFRPSLYEN